MQVVVMMELLTGWHNDGNGRVLGEGSGGINGV